MSMKDTTPEMQSRVFYTKLDNLIEKAELIKDEDQSVEIKEMIYKVMDNVENRKYGDQSVDDRHFDVLRQAEELINSIIEEQGTVEEGKTKNN